MSTSTSNIVPSNASTVTPAIPVPGPQTLKDMPRRAFPFIHTLGTQSSIRRIMAAHGYTNDDHEQGWKLLHDAGNGVDSVIVPDSPAADALKELDAWDELGFHKAHAALVLEFPNQAEFVFKDLAPRSGNDAILGVVQFLDRLDILEKGERAATKDDDKRAIDELTKRGIGPDERARLRRLVAVAHSSPEILLDAPSEASFQEQRMRTLTALYYWYERWVEVARVVVKQRNDTIMLGIAKRRAKKGSDAVTASDTVLGDVQRPGAMDGVTAGSNARVA